MSAYVKYISLLVLSGLILLFCMNFYSTAKSTAMVEAQVPSASGPAYFSPAQIIEFIAPALKF